MSQKRSPLDTFLIAATLALLLWLPLPLGSDRDWSAGLLVLCTALLTGLFCISKLRAPPDSNRTLRAA